MTREGNRLYNEIRPVKMTRQFIKHPLGSVLIEMGDTKVICNASVEERVPPFLKGKGKGWVTAEYDMMPASTHSRKQRAASKGKVDGRSQEIQRLVGRSMRSIVDLEALGERTIWIDCDVIQADGGTRTASITGAYVALKDCVDALMAQGVIEKNPLIGQIAAVSVGVVNGQALLDLDYQEDSSAEVDMNVVMNQAGDYIEVQGTGEARPFSRQELNAMYDLAEKGIQELIKVQNSASEV